MPALTLRFASPRLCPLLLLSILYNVSCATPPETSTAPGSVAQLDAEIARLESLARSAEQATLPAEFANAPKPGSPSLDPARNSASSQLKLYRLRQPFTDIETFAFIAANSDAASDLAKFRKLWESRKSVFEIVPIETSSPVLNRGLAQASGNRAAKLYGASLAYARIDSPASGLYYLASAEANLRFRDFVSSLKGGRESSSQPTLDAEAVRAALRSLENETLASFAGDPGSNTMIPVSSRLKEVREMLDDNLLEGASLMLLEARLILSRRTEAPGHTRLPPAAESEKSADSMRDLLLSLAEAEDAVTSTIVRNQLLPLYASLFVSTSAQGELPPPVTVTLVRWPYT